FARFLEFLDLASSRDTWLQQRFGEKKGGPVSQGVLEEWRAMVDNVTAALTSEHAELFLVTSAEEFSLNEAVRSADVLAESVPDLQISAVVLNRAVEKKSKCAACAYRAKMTAFAQDFIKKNFRGLPLKVAGDAGGPVLGATALRGFGEQIFRGKRAAGRQR